ALPISQRGQGVESAKRPWLSDTTPRPRHSGQIFGLVPGSAPLPWQAEHAVSSSTGVFIVAPLRESSKERLTTTSTSRPRSPLWRGRVVVLLAPPPKLSKSPPKRSERSPRPPMLPHHWYL